MANILVIDDERAIRNSIKDILEYEKYKVDTASDGEEGLKLFTENVYELVFCDIKMPKMNGTEFLQKAIDLQKDTPIVIISGHGNIEIAVDSIKKGAFDFIEKPIDINRLLVTVRNAIDKSQLVGETKTLRKKISKKYEMIGESEAITKIKNIIEVIAPTEARVLITGKNGTGKELVARQIYEKSKRNLDSFVEVNCAAIPSELIESELFGHEKGSFTSAIKQKKGKFELAHNGTLFLDEIGDMSLSAQSKVLRALQENKITRVGGEKEIEVNVRIIAATNKNLQQEIAENRFREDLYHRLSVILITVPPLNERKEDIPILADYFIKQICEEYGISPKNIQKEAIEEMKKREWTGNIRELKNIIERLIILSKKEIIKEDMINFCNFQI